MVYKTLRFDSKLLLFIAAEAHRRSITTPQDALVTILFSAAAVEGFINELGELARFQSQKEANALAAILEDSEKQRCSTAQKIHFISLVMTQQSFPRGTRVYEDFDLLFAVRNALVHLKTEVVDSSSDSKSRSQQHKLLRRVQTKCQIDVPDDLGEDSWLHVLSDRAVSRWAYESAVRIIREVVELIPNGIFRRMVNFVIEDMRPLPNDSSV